MKGSKKDIFEMRQEKVDLGIEKKNKEEKSYYFFYPDVFGRSAFYYNNHHLTQKKARKLGTRLIESLSWYVTNSLSYLMWDLTQIPLRND